MPEHLPGTLLFGHTLDEHPDESQFSMHVHSVYEIYFFISGSAAHLVEGNRYPLEPGCLLLTRPGESHRVLVEPQAPYERVVLQFDAAALAAVDPRGLLLAPFEKRPLGARNLYTRSHIDTGYAADCLLKLDFLPQEPYARRVALLGGLTAVLWELFRAFSRRNPGEEAAQAENETVRRALEYINRHLSGPLSLALLEERFFISRSQLNRLFKRATGCTVWEYVTVKRLVLARQLLRAGKPAAAACAQAGFGDYSSFYKAYRKKFGVSPQSDRPGEF